MAYAENALRALCELLFSAALRYTALVVHCITPHYPISHRALAQHYIVTHSTLERCCSCCGLHDTTLPRVALFLDHITVMAPQLLSVQSDQVESSRGALLNTLAILRGASAQVGIALCFAIAPCQLTPFFLFLCLYRSLLRTALPDVALLCIARHRPASGR